MLAWETYNFKCSQQCYRPIKGCMHGVSLCLGVDVMQYIPGSAECATPVHLNDPFKSSHQPYQHSRLIMPAWDSATQNKIQKEIKLDYRHEYCVTKCGNPGKETNERLFFGRYYGS